MGDLVKKEPDRIAENLSDACLKKYPFEFGIENPKSDVHGILNKLFQLINVADILQSVKAGAEYVVQVPEEFISALESGDVWMMENAKNGKMWPNLMRAAENGKQEIVTPLSIKRREFIQGNPMQELSTGFHNLYMQNQMQAMSQLIEESLETAKRIERGQKTDRMGLLESGRNQIFLALSQSDEEEKKQELRFARKSISDGFGQIFMALQDKVCNFEPISASRFNRAIHIAVNSSYYVKKDSEYCEIQEYLNLYIQATKMWAASFAVDGDVDGAKRVFEMSEGKLKALDFGNLKTIEYTHSGEDFEKIYSQKDHYIGIEKEVFDEELRENRDLSIAISGNELLEMISDGKRTTIPEQGTEHR